MQYVNVRGKTHAEALQQLRKSYGEEALILNEQHVPAENVIQRMLGKKEVVIKAALTERKQGVEQKVSLSKSVYSPPPSSANLEPANSLEPLKELIEQRQQRDQKKQLLSKVVSAPENSVHPEKESLADLKDEIASLKKMIGMLPISEKMIPHEFEDIANRFKRNGFSDRYISSFIKELQRNVPQSDWCDALKTEKSARNLLADRVQCCSRPVSKRVVALIGQTGVGKTTTIAKIATQFSLRYEKKIALFTIDNFRIAATEQLKIFADILNVDFKNARDPVQLRTMVEESNAEHIFLDCTGFNSKDKKASSEQSAFFQELPNMVEKHLVLSAASKLEDLQATAKNFLEIEYDCMIFSKIDESSSFGNLIELAEKFEKPISYLTTGQNVPDDIEKAGAEQISARIFQN